HTRGEMSTEEAERLFEVHRRTAVKGKTGWEIVPFSIGDLETLGRGHLQWCETVSEGERHRWELRWVQSFSYLERVSAAKRPEEIDQDELFKPVWGEVNAHLGTEARCFPELMEQLGVLRF